MSARISLISAFLFFVAAGTSQFANASNGTYLIGKTPASQAMGGTGVGFYSSDANAIYKNPALLSSVQPAHPASIEASLDYVSANSAGYLSGNASANNGASAPLIPTGAFAYHFSPSFAVGVGFFTLGGANTDYGQVPSLSNVKSDYSINRLPLAISYALSSKLSVGVSPFLSMGKFGLNGKGTTGVITNYPTQSATGYGVQAGIAYAPTDALGFGVTYISHSRVNYQKVIDLPAFSLAGPTGVPGDFAIDNPEELAAGMHYDLSSALTLTFDYRFIHWHTADGTKDVNWSNQNVFALGGEYKMNQWRLRAGVNYGTAVIHDNTSQTNFDSVMVQGQSILRSAEDVFALEAFPGFTTTHATLGAGYAFNDQWTADLAFVYGFNASVTRSGVAGSSYSFTGSASEWELSGGGKFLF